MEPRPKEPKAYGKAGKCPKHKRTDLVKDDHECCGCCCSGCDPEYRCPKCLELWQKKDRAWLATWCNMVYHDPFGQLDPKNPTPSMQGRFSQFKHGGKRLRKGSWAKIDPKTGLLKYSRKPTEFLVVA